MNSAGGLRGMECCSVGSGAVLWGGLFRLYGRDFGGGQSSLYRAISIAPKVTKESEYLGFDRFGFRKIAKGSIGIDRLEFGGIAQLVSGREVGVFEFFEQRQDFVKATKAELF